MPVVRPVPQVVDMNLNEPRLRSISDDAVRERPMKELRKNSKNPKNHVAQAFLPVWFFAKLGDRLRCPKPPQSRIINITSTARGQRCLSPSFSATPKACVNSSPTTRPAAPHQSSAAPNRS